LTPVAYTLAEEASDVWCVSNHFASIRSNSRAIPIRRNAGATNRYCSSPSQPCRSVRWPATWAITRPSRKRYVPGSRRQRVLRMMLAVEIRGHAGIGRAGGW